MKFHSCANINWHDHIIRRFINEQKSVGTSVDSFTFHWIQDVLHPVSRPQPNSSQRQIPSHHNINDTSKQPRYNEFGIQMISEHLHKQLFPDEVKTKDKALINECLENLKAYNFDKTQEPTPNINLDIPPLAGKTIEEHFLNIGEEQSKPYRDLLLELLKASPEIPKEWVMSPGWTKYDKNGAHQVDFPLEDAIVFDVEVCCSAGNLPTLATAMSKDAWYSWVGSELADSLGNTSVKRSFTPEHLIPLESTNSMKSGVPKNLIKPRIAVGHNVSYDRARVKEQYWLQRTGMRFIDTMSMHVCISGVTSYQKALLKAGVGSEEWSKLSSLNSLEKVYELYCQKKLSKSDREIFVTGTLEDVKNNFQSLMTYCANDVSATFSIMKHMFPIFLDRFPHPVTFAGMLELQSTYVPVNKNWKKYLIESQQAYEDFDLEAKGILMRSANEACKLLHNDMFKEDLWMWDQDWSTKPLNLKKTALSNKKCNDEVLEENKVELEANKAEVELDIVEEKRKALKQKYQKQRSLSLLLPKRAPHLSGYPKWFRKLCDKPLDPHWIPDPELISTSMKVVPKLLRLTWKLMPLHSEKSFGWGYLLPFKTSIPIESITNLPRDKLVLYYLNEYKDSFCPCAENKTSKLPFPRNVICSKKSKFKNNGGNFCKAEIGRYFGMVKLPHKDGSNLNVGNPLARDFINKFSESELSGASSHSKKIIEISRMLSYWRNNRERIENQLVCWLDPNDTQVECDMGVILPQVVVCGTLTRRAVEPTWMTASNAIVERVGSELRGIVQAPPKYVLIGADVDSQELWIASLLGDAYCIGIHGATPLGWMTLNGQKSDGTDMHSVTAKAVGISRNHAKVLNYARIYGAGQKFAQRLLKQFNPEMSDKEAFQKAEKMMTLTKGKKMYKLKDDGLIGVTERLYTKEGARELSSMYQKSKDELFSNVAWHGGSESSMFNSLEEIASQSHPRTPFLNSCLSRALEPTLEGNDKYMPTRINWVVQSGAVDFLHLMLVSMRWFLGQEIRFCLSFHDEVRYLVPENKKYQVALALHVTNLLTRSFCVSKLGMSDLPQSVAFFSSVDVDSVLRKECSDDNKTPSNPFGLSKGYGVSIGESLNIHTCISKANGIVGLRNKNKHRDST